MKEQYWIRPDTADFKSAWADMRAKSKSLTTAECAAEMWRARAEFAEQCHPWFEGDHQDLAQLAEVTDTWQRFATHPHARDKDYQ